MIPDHQLLNDLLVQVPDMDSTAAILSSLSSTTTQWLAEDAADGGSWWDAYINIFEVALKFVHSTIDGPFRSVGIDQTWGISIFIFTARTCRNVPCLLACVDNFHNVIEIQLTTDQIHSDPEYVFNTCFVRLLP